jgi:uncharacterized membrane protein
MQTASTTYRNIKQISELEHAALAGRSLAERIGDVIAREAGRVWFIALHFVWFAGWVALNLAPLGKTTFDPFPYPFLTMLVSLESIFLSLFILMSQNRSSQQADQRNHLELQINLLSEDENTKMLQMLKAICDHHKLAIANDPEIAAMGKKTEIKQVLSELQEHLPTDE